MKIVDRHLHSKIRTGQAGSYLTNMLSRFPPGFSIAAINQVLYATSKRRFCTVWQCHETAQQASRNVSAIAQTSQALNEGVRKASDEWFKFARTRIERAFEHFDKAARSRTPQELVAVQTEAVRDTLESMLQATQRIAQVSQQTADVASRKLSEAARRAA